MNRLWLSRVAGSLAGSLTGASLRPIARGGAIVFISTPYRVHDKTLLQLYVHHICTYVQSTYRNLLGL
jgi:hypothetical protein